MEGKGWKLLHFAAAFFLLVHGLAWLVLWLGLPMAMWPEWMELWAWRLFVVPMLVLLGGL